MVFRRKYWLFYLLTLFLGARGQIFIVFTVPAGRAFPVLGQHRFRPLHDQLCDQLVPQPAHRADHQPYRRAQALSIEYSTAILVFTGYATTGSAWVAGINTSSTTSCSISPSPCVLSSEDSRTAGHRPDHGRGSDHRHIAAIFVPALGGWLWVEFGYQIPFFIGAALSGCSLLLVQIIDREIRLHAPAKA